MRIVAEGREIDLRVSSMPTLLGEKLVMRILDKAEPAGPDGGPRLPHRSAGSVQARCSTQPHGLVLVTGPTGSGKTTTLYSALDLLRSPELNIVTIEDPVEYQLDLINQMQVHESIGLTFARALRSILRQDPDVIMVGEIRDEETARVAVQAALTGHLVLATLHTNDAPGAVARLLDMGIEPYLLSAARSTAWSRSGWRGRSARPARRSTIPTEQELRDAELSDKAGRPFRKGAGLPAVPRQRLSRALRHLRGDGGHAGAAADDPPRAPSHELREQCRKQGGCRCAKRACCWRWRARAASTRS